MNKQYLKYLLIELILIIFSFLQFAVLKQYNIYLYVFELLAIMIVIKFLNPFDLKNHFNKKEALLIVLIFCLGYYAITYFLGFFIGFVKSSYSRSLLGIIRNVFFSVSFIIILELLREVLIEKVRYYKSLVFLTCIVLTILELLFSVSILYFSSRRTALEILMTFVIPCFARNIFLTYSTYYFGKEISITYHLLIDTVNYLVPVFPNISEYLTQVLAVLHPLILIFITSNLIVFKRQEKEDFVTMKRKKRVKNVVFSLSFAFLFLVVYLVSDIGRFTILAVGSGSMEGSIDKGDIVFIDKNDKNYKVGDVIVFQYSGTIIVHRIVKIKNDKSKIYLTKGDANNAIDNWELNDDNIKGKCKFIIKYLGIPTVALSEFLSEK